MSICTQSGHKATETPVQFFYDCIGLPRAPVRPKSAHCCVFCSYGAVACLPIQEARAAGTMASCCCG